MLVLRGALVALALTGSVMFASAAPAQAAPPVLRNVYYAYSDCAMYGAEGVQEGLWSSYTCQPNYIFWFLYA